MTSRHSCMHRFSIIIEREHCCVDPAHRHGEPHSGVAIQGIGNMFWPRSARHDEETCATAQFDDLRNCKRGYERIFNGVE